ncbi:MAG: glycoside hydrolase family 127 protein [Clostridia bacterium]|nr:glycoside hydrolase family 127 protein [Clostridia bacterium]
MQAIGFEKVDITGGFWADKQKLNREVTIRSVHDRFADTGRFRAFEFTWKEGSDEPKPHFFWDSDIAKWLESAADIIAKTPDPGLLAEVDRVIDLIEEHMDPDGYFNIYHTVVEPELRFKNRDHHELYCLGHLIEAAVAYRTATGSDRFIDVLDKYVDLVIKAFVTEKTAAFATPGHEEIELALIKLYRVRPDRKYLDLAMFFLNERGKKEERLGDWAKGMYNQSHLPVREQRTAEGHSVRACYLYSAMADAAKETGDEALFTACKAIFDDITQKKMYISGGVGSSHMGEAFTVAYDLPNDTAYNETCAAIALSFFADRMKDLELDSRYADVVEREMYNGVIAGLSLDGRSFFYENPLEINLIDRVRHPSVSADDRLPITQRLEVFGCSCCPPNVTRYIASIGGTAVSADENAVYLHQFMPMTADTPFGKLSVETDYPRNGKIKISLSADEASGKKPRLYVRIPGWCRNYAFSAPYSVEKGYAVFETDGREFSLEADLSMKVELYRADRRARADAGRVAVMYGPVLYCAEAVDNGSELFDLRLDEDCEPGISYDSYFGANVIKMKAYRTEPAPDALLYLVSDPPKKETEAKLIPYYAFANRGESDMAVWLRKA